LNHEVQKFTGNFPEGRFTWEKFFMTVVELIGQFFLQNDVFKLQEKSFQSLVLEYSLKTKLEEMLKGF
jgi:hypothetical protein